MTASSALDLFSLSGGILALLALMLLLTLAIIIERVWYFAYVGQAATADPNDDPGEQRNELAEYAERRAGAPEGDFARYALARLDTPAVALERSLEQRVLGILPTLDRRLWLLDSTVTLAPLLGLLGSIVGMVRTFNLLGIHAADTTATTGGIANALVATGGGLLVAIVAVVGLNACNNRIREIVRRLDTVKLAALGIAQREQGGLTHAARPQVVAGSGWARRVD